MVQAGQRSPPCLSWVTPPRRDNQLCSLCGIQLPLCPGSRGSRSSGQLDSCSPTRGICSERLIARDRETHRYVCVLAVSHSFLIIQMMLYCEMYRPEGFYVEPACLCMWTILSPAEAKPVSVRVFMFQEHKPEAAMENHVTQITKDDLEDLREAFNKIGQFHSHTHTDTPNLTPQPRTTATTQYKHGCFQWQRRSIVFFSLISIICIYLLLHVKMAAVKKGSIVAKEIFLQPDHKALSYVRDFYCWGC